MPRANFDNLYELNIFVILPYNYPKIKICPVKQKRSDKSERFVSDIAFLVRYTRRKLIH